MPIIIWIRYTKYDLSEAWTAQKHILPKLHPTPFYTHLQTFIKQTSSVSNLYIPISIVYSTQCIHNLEHQQSVCIDRGTFKNIVLNIILWYYYIIHAHSWTKTQCVCTKPKHPQRTAYTHYITHTSNTKHVQRLGKRRLSAPQYAVLDRLKWKEKEFAI